MVKCGKQADFLDHVADAAAELDEIPIGGRAIFNQHLAEVGNSSPFSIFSAVVFPEPLRPSSTSVRPGSMRKFRLSRMRLPPMR